MRIATYNLRFGGSGKRIHWRKIFELANPDILLLQETYDAEQYMSAEFCQCNSDRILWSRVKAGKWGSGLYVKHGRVRPVEVRSFNGFIVGAEVNDFDFSQNSKSKLLVFSLHAPPPYVKKVNEFLNFLADFKDDYDLVIGGDFNLTVGIRHESEKLGNLKSELSLLERLEQEFNLINCWQAANPDSPLPQTLRWSRNKMTPYHCDGIFVPAAWGQYLESCDVLSSEDWELLSDHNPVVATFEL